MKGKFAKLFDLANGEQVVVMKDYDSDDEQFQFVAYLEFDGVSMKAKFGYDEQEKRDHHFDKFDIDEAFKLYEKINENFV